MRHRVAGRTLGRNSAQRTALRRNLMADLFREDRIKTTAAKAAAIRGESEKLISLGKRGVARRNVEESDFRERRQAAAVSARQARRQAAV